MLPKTLKPAGLLEESESAALLKAEILETRACLPVMEICILGQKKKKARKNLSHIINSNIFPLSMGSKLKV